MSKPGKIIFWISFPLTAIITLLLLIFYLDLANGPLAIFILTIVAFVLMASIRIILRHKKFVIRMIPTLSFVLTVAILLPFAKPSLKTKSVAYYDNPVKTEVLTLENGQVQGLYNEDKTVEIYGGIPYAEAPIGELRWKEPVNKKNWDGVLDCSNFGPRAMQNDSSAVVNSLVDLYAEKSWHPDFKEGHIEPMSEDCLNLTMWKPAGDVSNLPILVYIHGGSLTSGAASFEDYNGEEVAKKGVIMINVQYRLGIFGYFAHHDLAKESPNGTTGNYGLLDQIKALEWVNNNASYFGGDKNNITIAGESAGSSSVSAICSSPLASGKFKRAIGESSSVVVKRAPHTFRKYEDAVKMGQQIMEEMKCSSLEEMRKLDASKLLNSKYTNSSMTVDGYALTKTPYEVYMAHENNEDELLNGFNVLEADAFVVPQYLFNPTNKSNIHERLVETFGDVFASQIEEVYKDKIEKDAFSAFNEIFSVYWFMYPHHSWTNMALQNGVKVYRYQFTKENGYYGTYHSGEMIYCYGNVKKSPYYYRYNESDLKLSEIMLTYWTNFAKNGNPNSEGLQNWPLFSYENPDIIELGNNVGPIKDPYGDLYPIIEAFIDSQIINDK